MKRLLIAALFISPSVFASYTTMTIEGVKQSNGVWTTAGVMDTQGFVRTTGAVTVAGSVRNVPVTVAVDVLPLGPLVKSTAKAMGPIALAATAYDLYTFFTDNGIGVEGDGWVIPKPNPGPMEVPGQYTSTDGTTAVASSPHGSMDILFNDNANWKKYKSGDPDYTFNCYPLTNAVRCSLYWKGGLQLTAVFYYYVCSGQDVSTCTPSPPVPDTTWDTLPALTVPLIVSGLNKLPTLKDTPLPIKSTDFTPYSDWISDPYFKDGNWWRDRMDVSPAPTPSQPTRVRVDIGPVKLEGQTDPTVKPDDTPASANTQPKEQTKFCDDNPFSIACQEMGEAEPEPIEPDEKQFQLNTNQSWGASNGACPASPSVTLFTGEVITFDYQPTCDFLALLRPIIIAFALMTAIFIALGRTD
ncbi:hypothetical protein GWG10_11390 [Aeromonas caviae]|uniref:virulence factor TspB C-terminal domain-related protein n=1 Tax=Aeromonas caviae TaxID=648 RepID=UPI0015DDD2E7|nr:virulence factor TspB C-terminal domain-related protein [Aeromonas caviae]QLL88758.1 hypothetical protein GWG10_11345 [Aeromonas caviae]QLL88767.1 hypothetical protein GWG10_11390 [Aeromonas caviae]